MEHVTLLIHAVELIALFREIHEAGICSMKMADSCEKL
jgi:hypothetical protein